MFLRCPKDISGLLGWKKETLRSTQKTKIIKQDTHRILSRRWSQRPRLAFSEICPALFVVESDQLFIDGFRVLFLDPLPIEYQERRVKQGRQTPELPRSLNSKTAAEGRRTNALFSSEVSYLNTEFPAGQGKAECKDVALPKSFVYVFQYLERNRKIFENICTELVSLEKKIRERKGCNA